MQLEIEKTALEKEKDAIDSKIDALNDEKDALKDKNDEQQRELDLIEAQNNLDKAKKQKVFVYKEGEGLVQVQDEKTVKDAQKELDDVEREIKEADIDKQIEVYEKQQGGKRYALFRLRRLVCRASLYRFCVAIHRGVLP